MSVLSSVTWLFAKKERRHIMPCALKPQARALPPVSSPTWASHHCQREREGPWMSCSPTRSPLWPLLLCHTLGQDPTGASGSRPLLLRKHPWQGRCLSATHLTFLPVQLRPPLAHTQPCASSLTFTRGSHGPPVGAMLRQAGFPKVVLWNTTGRMQRPRRSHHLS